MGGRLPLQALARMPGRPTWCALSSPYRHMLTYASTPAPLLRQVRCYVAVILMMLCVPNVRHLMDGFILQMEDGAQYKKYENGVFHPEHVQDSARQPLPGQVGHCDYSPECSTEGSDQVCGHIWSSPHNRLSTQHALVMMKAYSIVQAVLNRL
jgi:hypothetical protein